MKRLICVVVALVFSASAQAATVVNGDFEGGNTGFSSAYTYNTSPNGLWNTGSYAVTSNPLNQHDLATSLLANGGTGMMLAVHGDNNIDQPFWSQSLILTAGNSYSFVFWNASWGNPQYGDVNSSIALYLGDTNVASFSTGALAGVWQQATYNFIASATGGMTFSLRSAGGAISAFAIDDINLVDTTPPPSMVPVPAALPLLVGAISGLGFMGRRRRA